MKTYTLMEWQNEGVKLFGNIWRTWKFVCPMCHHVQGAEEFSERTDVKKEDIERILGFSCIGRHLKEQVKYPDNQDDHAFPVKMKGGGCNWTLGGLFTFNTAEIIDDMGKTFPVFEFYIEEEA